MNAPRLHDDRLSMVDQVFAFGMFALALPVSSQRCDADMIVMEAVDLLPSLNTANMHIAELCGYLAEFRAAQSQRERDAVRWKMNQSLTRFSRARFAQGLSRLRGDA